MLYISAWRRFGSIIERAAEPGRRTSEGNMLQWRLPIGEGGKSAHDFSRPDLMVGGTTADYGPAVVSSATSVYEKAHELAGIARPAMARL
jgi:hypothetical protein